MRFRGKIVLLAAGLLSACTDPGTSGSENRGERTVPVTITSVESRMRTGYLFDEEKGLHRTEWRVGDKLGLFAYDDEGNMPAGQNANIPFGIASAADIDANGAALFKGDITLGSSYTDGETVAGHYFAYYPYQPDAAGGTSSLTLNLPAEQTGDYTTFDGSADFLLGVPVSAIAPPGKMSTTDEGRYEPVNFTFIRPFAIACITLSDLPAQIPAQEIAAEIRVSAGEGQAIAGAFVADIGAAVPAVSLNADGSLATANGSNTITLTTTQTFAQNDLKLWLIMAPVTAPHLKIEIESENWTVSRTVASAMKFEAGKLNLAAVSLASAEVVRKSAPEPDAPATYSQVASAADVTEGEYLVIAEKDGAFYTLGGQSADFIDAWQIGADLFSEGVFTDDAAGTLYDRSVTLGQAEGGFTIQSNAPDIRGKYLYAAGVSGGNLLRTRDSNDDASGVWSIANHAAPLLNINATAEISYKSLRFNFNNGSPRFSCYTTGSKNLHVSLYKKSAAANSSSPIEVPGNI